MRTFNWKPRDDKGTHWSLYCGVVLLGSMHYDTWRHVWQCSNYRFRTGMETGQFYSLNEAAKWLLGYDMRPIKGWQKHGSKHGS